ncbi:MAG: pectate lyase [Rhodocyclaceae bacterium]
MKCEVKAAMAMLLASVMLSACGGGGGSGSTGDASSSASSAASSGGSSSSASEASSSSSSTATISSLGADGWASVGTGTTGGHGAASDKIYTVSNRNELIQALYGKGASIADDGSVSGTLDASPKIIYVSGTISLNMNKALVEYTDDAYVQASCAATEGYATAAAMWSAYYAAYRPSVWGVGAVSEPDSVDNVRGKPAYARGCAATLQKKVVMLKVPSNTSIIGLGSSAKIVHGTLVLGESSAAVDNIVVRNLGFEDAFDFFPAWDPTDSNTGRWNSAYDLISVMYATHVWIDHNTFSDGSRIDHDYPSVWTETVGGVDYSASDFKVQHHDGLIDVTKVGNYVTISHNDFHDHDKSFLIGGTDTPSTTAENPSVLKVTFHDNYFRNLKQRQVRVRYGMVHLYNNYYEGSLASTANYSWLVGWTVGQSGKIHAENNVFAIGPGSNAAATVANLYGASISTSKITTCTALGYSADQCGAFFYDSGTVLNGVTVNVTGAITAAYSTVSGTQYWSPATYYSYGLAATTNLASTVPAAAGVGKL